MILLERGKFTLKLFRLERQEVHKDTAEVAHIARGSSRKRAQRIKRRKERGDTADYREGHREVWVTIQELVQS